MPPSEHGHNSLDDEQNHVAFPFGIMPKLVQIGAKIRYFRELTKCLCHIFLAFKEKNSESGKNSDLLGKVYDIFQLVPEIMWKTLMILIEPLNLSARLPKGYD